MKTYKLHLILIILIGLFTCLFSQELQVKTDTTCYFEGEPIWCKVSIINNTSEDLKVPILGNYSLGNHLYFELEDQNGDKIGFVCMLANLAYTPFTEIGPGKFVSEYYDLLWNFGENYPLIKIGGARKYLKSGKYNLTVNLKFQSDLKSSLSFAVAEATGKNKDEFEIYKKAYANRNPELHKSLIEMNPKSKYAGLSYLALGAYYSVKNQPQKTIILMKELIEHHFNSAFAIKGIESMSSIYFYVLNQKGKLKEEIYNINEKYGQLNPELAKKIEIIKEKYEINNCWWW